MGASRQIATLQEHIIVKHNNTPHTHTHTHTHTDTYPHTRKKTHAQARTQTHTHSHKLSVQTLNVWEPRESRHADTRLPWKLGLVDKK